MNYAAAVRDIWRHHDRGTAASHYVHLVRYATLADYSRGSGQDRNSLLVDYDIFMRVPMLDAQGPDVQKVYAAGEFDFRLKPGSAAVDRGTSLPGVTDGFAGRAPDLGALESGAPVPHYGPRR